MLVLFDRSHGFVCGTGGAAIKYVIEHVAPIPNITLPVCLAPSTPSEHTVAQIGHRQIDLHPHHHPNNTETDLTMKC